MQFQYLAPVVRADLKNYALIEVIDESVTRGLNPWRINPAGKLRALAGVLTMPLLGPPRLGHEAIDAVGHPVDFTSNRTTSVLYHIPNPADYERIKSGEWKYVSPQLTFLKEHYEGDVQVIDEWRFDHVAFVEKGAFPNAGVKGTCEGDPRLCGFSRAVTAALADPWRMRDSIGSLISVPLGRVSPHAAARSTAPTQRIVRAGKLVEIETIGSLVGVPLGRSK
jgi:hypothetical protein